LNILFLSSWYPYPPDNGSKLRIFNLLQGLAQHHDITLITFSDEMPAAVPLELAKLCRTVTVVPRRRFNPRSAAALAGAFSLKPRSVLDTYQPQMAEEISRVLQEQPIHLVIASQWWTAVYWKAFAHLPSIYEEVELGFFAGQMEQAASPRERLRHRLTWLKLQLYLRRLLPHFNACTVVSEIEKTMLQEIIPNYRDIYVIPNCINPADYADFRSRPQPDTLIFSGSLSYSPNRDAMTWFLAEVYPLIKVKIPAVHLTITGDYGGNPIPTTDGITLTGFVEDVRPLIASSWISLVPLRQGGGTRLKILEAMALGTPVVATHKGAEGLQVQDNEHLLIADTPQQFANAVIRLLQDSELRCQLSANACHLVERQYDWTTIMPEFLILTEKVSYVS
jgi:glycosyltransferase involved in cell wall biosynthesis